MGEKIKQLINFITYGVWSIKGQHGRWLDMLISEIKIFIITFKNYGRHKIAVRSAALTYYTLISIVPITAMVLGLSKGFGIEEELLRYVADTFPDSKDVISYVTQFANSFLANSNLSVFAGISVLVLLWSVFMVFFNIEEAFNFIWEIKKSRPISRKVSDYLAIVIILPILYTISSSVKDIVQNAIDQIISNNLFLNYLYQFLLTLLYLAIVWLIFAVIYIVLPSTKVKFKAAFHAAIFAGCGYIAFKYLYVFFQSSVSNYNIVYGSFAALPLLLLWLNICWQIILFGAELSFAYQNMARYEYELAAGSFSVNFRRKLMVLVVRAMIKNFISQSRPLSTEEIAKETNMPVAAVRDIIYYLLKAKVVYSVEDFALQEKTSYYTMAVDVSTLTVGGLVSMVDNDGTSRIDGVEGFDLVDDLKSKSTMLIKDL